MIDYLNILGDDKYPSLFSSREKEFYDKDNQLVRTSSDVEVKKPVFLSIFAWRCTDKKPQVYNTVCKKFANSVTQDRMFTYFLDRIEGSFSTVG